MKKQIKTSKKITPEGKQAILDFKNRREILSRSISLEVDLENRQIFFQKDLTEKLEFDFISNDVDSFIKTYLDPKDSRKVKQSLTKAKKGLEKPILFNFIHPLTSKAFQFEYRYQIIYVKYSSTRLKGELVNLRDPKRKTLIKPLKKIK